MNMIMIYDWLDTHGIGVVDHKCFWLTKIYSLWKGHLEPENQCCELAKLILSPSIESKQKLDNQLMIELDVV